MVILAQPCTYEAKYTRQQCQ